MNNPMRSALQRVQRAFFAWFLRSENNCASHRTWQIFWISDTHRTAIFISYARRVRRKCFCSAAVSSWEFTILLRKECHSVWESFFLLLLLLLRLTNVAQTVWTKDTVQENHEKKTHKNETSFDAKYGKLVVSIHNCFIYWKNKVFARGTGLYACNTIPFHRNKCG